MKTIKILVLGSLAVYDHVPNTLKKFPFGNVEFVEYNNSSFSLTRVFGTQKLVPNQENVLEEYRTSLQEYVSIHQPHILVPDSYTSKEEMEMYLSLEPQLAVICTSSRDDLNAKLFGWGAKGAFPKNYPLDWEKKDVVFAGMGAGKPTKYGVHPEFVVWLEHNSTLLESRKMLEVTEKFVSSTQKNIDSLMNLETPNLALLKLGRKLYDEYPEIALKINNGENITPKEKSFLQKIFG